MPPKLTGKFHATEANWKAGEATNKNVDNDQFSA
jgi:hypothetical protein